MSKFIGSFLSLVFLFGAGLGLAGETTEEAGTFYSRGTHLFFDGNYDQAVEQFDGAIERAPDNPVYYYFRGLCDWRRGDSDQASGWFLHAAEKENTPAGRLIDVGAQLRRIQGAERQKIEEFRQQAKKEWQEQETARQIALYGETLDRQKEILSRQKTPVTVSGTAGEKSVDTEQVEGLPLVPPIQPLSDRQESSAAISPDLAEYGTGEIIYLKEEQGKTSLSTAAQRRREARARRLAYANPMDRPAADGSKFIDIFSSDEVYADGAAFDDGGESALPGERERQQAEAAEQAVEQGIGGLLGGMGGMMGALTGTPQSGEDAADQTTELFGEEKPANPFADKSAPPATDEFKLFEEDKKFSGTPAAAQNPDDVPAAPGGKPSGRYEGRPSGPGGPMSD